MLAEHTHPQSQNPLIIGTAERRYGVNSVLGTWHVIDLLNGNLSVLTLGTDEQAARNHAYVMSLADLYRRD